MSEYGMYDSGLFYPRRRRQIKLHCLLPQKRRRGQLQPFASRWLLPKAPLLGLLLSSPRLWQWQQRPRQLRLRRSLGA